MRTSIILVLCLTLTLTSAQLPNYFQSNNSPAPQSNWGNGGSSNSWGNSAPATNWGLGSPGLPSPNWGSSGAAVPQSQFQAYNRPASASPAPSWSAPQPSSWSQYQPINRGASIPPAPSAYAGFNLPSSGGYSGNSAPAVAQPQAAPAGPAQFSWNINHGQGQAAPAPAAYNVPAAPSSWRAPAVPAAPSSWRAPAAPSSWSAPAAPSSWSAPQSSYNAAPAPSTQWSAPAPSQSWSAPAPAQSWSAPAPAPAAPLPAPQSSYQSPQNSQNYNPAPVHYSSIGPQLQGDYKFGYHTGNGGSFREETRLPDGTVQGAYGFVDVNGKQRVVKYTAGKNGFQAEGDDVPKASPVDGASSQAAPQYSPPANIGEGQAFRSFQQG